MNDYDRIKRAIADLAQAVFPNADAVKTWAGKFARQAGQAGDVTTDLATKVAGTQNIPFRYPFPGLTFTVDTTQGPRCVMAMLSGDPSLPIILAWENPGLSTWDLNAEQEISLQAPAVNLGQKAATDALVKGTTYRQAEDTLFSQLNTQLATAGAAITAACAIPTWPAAASALAPAGVALTSLAAAFAAFQAAESTYLSTIVKTS